LAAAVQVSYINDDRGIFQAVNAIEAISRIGSNLSRS
jgi:hypothetical protein